MLVTGLQGLARANIDLYFDCDQGLNTIAQLPDNDSAVVHFHQRQGTSLHYVITLRHHIITHIIHVGQKINSAERTLNLIQ